MNDVPSHTCTTLFTMPHRWPDDRYIGAVDAGAAQQYERVQSASSGQSTYVKILSKIYNRDTNSRSFRRNSLLS